MRYKKYKYGGKKVPGMYAQEGGDIPERTKNTSLSPDESMINTVNINNGDTTRSSRPNPMNVDMMTTLPYLQMQQQNEINHQKKITEQKMIMQMKLQNDSLEQQNKLLKTQIQKSDLINSARNTKQKAGSSNTPKKRGGMVKAKNGKEKDFLIFAQGSGGVMKRGGSVLPRGAFSKKRR